MGLVELYSKHSALAIKYDALRALPLKSIADQGKPVNTRRAKRITARDVAEAIRLYHAGRTVYEIQSELGFHRETVAKALTAAGVRMRRGHLTKSDTLDAIQRYEAGESTAKIGRALGYSPQSVQRRLVKEGVTLRARGRPRGSA